MVFNEEKIAMIEEAMDLDEGTLKPEDELDSYEEWDSLSKLSLVATAKQQLDVTLDVSTLRQVVTVSDLCALLG